MWDDGKGVCVGWEFSVTFCVPSIFFCILAHAYRSHQITTIYGLKHMLPHKVGPCGGLDDKNNVWGSRLPKT